MGSSSRSASKNIGNILTQKLFLISRKYDPGYSSWIRIFSWIRIPDIGVKKAPDPGFGTATLISIKGGIRKRGIFLCVPVLYIKLFANFDLYFLHLFSLRFVTDFVFCAILFKSF